MLNETWPLPQEASRTQIPPSLEFSLHHSQIPIPIPISLTPLQLLASLLFLIVLMANAGEEAPVNVKRLRRPSVRLNYPYYEYPNQWKNTTKKPRTLKKGDEIEDLSCDDNIAIGNWKGVNRRVSSTKLGPEKPRKIGDLEIEKSPSPSNQEEEDLGGNGISTNLVRKDLDPNWNVDKNAGAGVRMWLNRLGLGKYGRVFEVHGVDDQVLPLLTLEDLKEMGISQVGIRRKMFCSIQSFVNPNVSKF